MAAPNENGFPHKVVGKPCRCLTFNSPGARDPNPSQSLGSGQAFGAARIEAKCDSVALAGRQQHGMRFRDDLTVANDFRLDLILVRSTGNETGGKEFRWLPVLLVSIPLIVTLASSGTKTMITPLSPSVDSTEARLGTTGAGAAGGVPAGVGVAPSTAGKVAEPHMAPE